MRNAVDKDGKRVKEGDTVVDFRGRDWTFISVGTGNRVNVKDKDSLTREFFPSVFDLNIIEDPDMRDCSICRGEHPVGVHPHTRE